MIEFSPALRFAGSVVSAWRRDPQFRYLTFLVVITLLGGTIFYSLVEGWSVVDAFYFSATTLTTVGLGDLAPKSTVGKLFTVVYIFAGLSIILGFIDTVAKQTLSRHTGRVGREEGQEEDTPTVRLGQTLLLQTSGTPSRRSSSQNNSSTGVRTSY